MKALFALLAALVVLAAGFYALNNLNATHPQTNMNQQTNNTPVTIVPIEHASGILSWAGTTVYFDPVGGAEAYAGQPKPDVILVTDIHGDHFSTSTLSAIRGEAILVVPLAVQGELPDELKARTAVLRNGERTVQNGITIEATPMYNLPDADNADKHSKGRGNGYLLEKDGYRVLIAGDTAGTPELRALQNIDIAFVPMNLPYTMSVDEAADAVLDFKPKIVYPYHYRQPDGLADVARFKQLVNAGDPAIEVVLARWYPNR